MEKSDRIWSFIFTVMGVLLSAEVIFDVIPPHGDRNFILIYALLSLIISMLYDEKGKRQ